MRFTQSLLGLAAVILTNILSLISAQDQCNQLPLRAHVDLPLRHYPPNSTTTTNQTLCDRYAPKNATQLAWITRIINTAFVGNYPPVQGPAYPQDPNGTYQATGILDPHGYYLDPCKVNYPVNLLQYFNGSSRSTNRGGKAVALNFLDGGSVIALKDLVPAYDTQSNQYKMMLGFYQYFGYFFGCSDGSIPHYNGSSSQTMVHRFMDLPSEYIHYFIHNIVDSSTTVGGVSLADIVTHLGDGISIGVALDNIFNKKCSPSQKVISYQESELQSICSDAATCAPWTFENATCSAYNLSSYGVQPKKAQTWESKAQYCAQQFSR